MKKTLIALALLAAAVISVAACSESTGAPAYAEPVTQVTTTTAAEQSSVTAPEVNTSLPTPTAAQTTEETKRAAAPAKAATAAQTARPEATQAITRTATPTTRQTTTTTRTTTTTTTAPKPQTQPQKPVYTEADYAEIVAAVREYAESKAFPFIWDTTLTYEYAQSGRAGFHDVVNLNQNGKGGTIKTLKYNADLTEDVVTNPMYGVPSNQVHYNVVWLEYQSEPYFALIYG